MAYSWSFSSGSRGNCALTIEAQRDPMEQWHGPIFVMWHVGPRTFVLFHPSICVGWTDPSQESPNCLFASALSTYLLHSYCHPFLFFASILIVLYLVDLYNLLSISILFEFAFSPLLPDSLFTSCDYSNVCQ